MKNKIIINIFIFLLLFILTIGSPLASNIIKNETQEIEIYINQDYTVNNKIKSILQLVNEDSLREHLINLLSVSPRYTGTEGCELAADYIYQQFQSSGLKSRYHDWESFGNKYHPKFFKSQNVEGELPGTKTDKIIIFNAHYDTVQNTPGANDDGSGTAAVIVAAKILSQFSFNHTLRFVTFSGEEIGLKGSEAYAEECYNNGDDILVDINADMIGYATTKKGGKYMRFSVTEDAQWIPDIFKSINTSENLQFSFDNYLIDREGRGYSDYYPFTTYGWEAVACWEGDGDPNMHQETDTIDKINFSYFVNTTKLIIGTLAYLADSNEFYPQLKITYPYRQSYYINGIKIKNTKNLNSIIFNNFKVKAETHNLEKYPIERVEFYFDDILYFTDSSKPFSWNCNIFSCGKHRITVISYDHVGQKTMDYQDIFYVNFNTFR